MRGPKFYRADEVVDEKPSSTSPWFKEFSKKLDDKSVRASVDDNNMYGALAKMLFRDNIKSKHSSVASLVKEYQERTGLLKYLETLKQAKKIAQQSGFDIADLFNSVAPDVKEKIVNFIKNRVQAFRGDISVLAIQDEILKNFKTNGLDIGQVYDAGVSGFISTLIAKEKSDHPAIDSGMGQLGKNSPEPMEENNSNDNFFYSMENKL